MKKTLVILNESHSLLPDQERILNERFGNTWEIFPVPSSGWTLDEQREIAKNFYNSDIEALVFASPVPVLLKLASAYHADVVRNELDSYEGAFYNGDTYPAVYVFHNDCRDKKELPDGKVIMTVAKEGWELV